MKVVINPSWLCQLSCPYCWLPHTKINRRAEEHPWQEWARELVRTLPGGSVVDVSGGEPLLYNGLINLLEYLGDNGVRWAITTNAMCTDRIEELVERRPRGAVVVNVSDHSGNAEAHENIKRLREAFAVVVHRCDHPGAGQHEGHAGMIPYQRWAEGEALDGVKRICNAGVEHWVIDPGGDIFRCCVDMQLAHEPLGNLFGGPIEKAKPFECDFGCSSCYTTEPRAWLIEMRPA